MNKARALGRSQDKVRPGHNLKIAKVKFMYTRVHLLCMHEVTSIVGRGLPRFLPPLGPSKFTQNPIYIRFISFIFKFKFSATLKIAIFAPAVSW